MQPGPVAAPVARVDQRARGAFESYLLAVDTACQYEDDLLPLRLELVV